MTLSTRFIKEERDTMKCLTFDLYIISELLWDFKLISGEVDCFCGKFKGHKIVGTYRMKIIAI